MTRRQLLMAAFAAPGPGFRLTDVTAQAGLSFRHNTGAFGAKYLPETMGSGCAFLDYDNDGWPDILLINGRDWPGHERQRSTLRLFRNNRNGTFTDVTRAAGLDVEMYGMGVAVGDFNNDGFPDLYITAVGQNRLFRNNGRGRFVDVTIPAGLGSRSAFSTSALWFDYDRDGHLDLFVCNYVRWSPEQDVNCSLDGKSKSYCTPEAYRGATGWLFHNKGDGTFEDVTAESGIFDPSSKSLGVAMLDLDNDGWPDLFVANDTQPNKLYRNNRDGTFTESAVRMGVAFSEDGKARAGMGVDTGDYQRSGRMGIAVTNFDNEMMGLYESTGRGFVDRAIPAGVGAASRQRLGFGCVFADVDLDGYLDLIAVNGHIDDTVRSLGRGAAHAQVPHLFLNDGKGRFRDVAVEAGREFAVPKIGRGIALGDFDRDGDLDVLITTNSGPALLFRNDVSSGNQSIRFRLEGRKSNRDGIGAVVQVFDASGMQMQMVKSGSSYLSSSDKSLTFGVGSRTHVDRVAIFWPSGRADEFRKLAAGKTYLCVEGENPRPQRGR
ncbi:MAG TPA: CRTAC1 family protein [Bryobacteraceae bacterium]|nr:CRTAC1 family protein [Bryobacteraceae bacterium]